MHKLIGLFCLFGLQLVGGISNDYSNSFFKRSENVISEILSVFESDNLSTEKSRLFDEGNDELCMEQVNTILRGVNNSELWAIKSECYN